MKSLDRSRRINQLQTFYPAALQINSAQPGRVSPHLDAIRTTNNYQKPRKPAIRRENPRLQNK
jgi:hypothetical protein